MLALFGCEEPPPASALTVGDAFPELPLADLYAKPKNFAPPIGKVTVLNIWATWCPPCRAEMPSLQRLADQLPSEKFAVVGIAMNDDDHLVREFLREQRVMFDNYLDVTPRVSSEVLKVVTIPSTFLIDSEGRVVEVLVGERHWDEPEILTVIRAIQPVGGGE